MASRQGASWVWGEPEVQLWPTKWTGYTFSLLLGVTRRAGPLSGGERWVVWKPRETPLAQPCLLSKALARAGVSQQEWAPLTQSVDTSPIPLSLGNCILSTVTQERSPVLCPECPAPAALSLFPQPWHRPPVHPTELSTPVYLSGSCRLRATQRCLHSLITWHMCLLGLFSAWDPSYNKAQPLSSRRLAHAPPRILATENLTCRGVRTSTPVSSAERHRESNEQSGKALEPGC